MKAASRFLLALSSLLLALFGTAVAEVHSNGLIFESLVQGTGPSPTASDVIKVHYRGYFPDSGREFDSSYARNRPIEFSLGSVIACWQEGTQRMKVGGKARFTCPPSLAYGTRGSGRVIPPNATLSFDVELLGIQGR